VGGEGDPALPVGGLVILPLSAVGRDVEAVQRVGGVQPAAVEWEAFALAHALVETLELPARGLADAVGQRERLAAVAALRPASAGELATLDARGNPGATGDRATRRAPSQPAGAVVTLELGVRAPAALQTGARTGAVLWNVPVPAFVAALGAARVLGARL